MLLTRGYPGPVLLRSNNCIVVLDKYKIKGTVMGVLHKNGHLIQGREPSPVGASLTNAVCRLIAHQDPGDGKIPGMKKLESQERISLSILITYYDIDHLKVG